MENVEKEINNGYLTTNKLLNEIIQIFNTYNYSDYELKHYFDDNNSI